MATQTATTGNLANAQRIAIAQCRYTMEHSMPVVNLIEKMNLKKGEKQRTVPKVGQMTASDLTDGVDLTDSEDIGMTTVDLTASRVGLKVILTDTLILQEAEDVHKIVGRQMGDAMARKKDRDAIALFAGLNGGTAFGADNKNLTMANLAASITTGKAKKWPAPLVVVHHPNALYQTVVSAAITPLATYPIPHGYSEELLKDFYKFYVNGAVVFEDGNIDKVAGQDSGYGVIMSKSALVVLEQVGFTTATERDESLFATELIVSANYGMFELDDGYGAPMLYEIGDPSTSA